MDNRLAVKITEKNESSLCMILLASIMLTATVLLAVLPPVVNRHHYDKYTHVTSGEHTRDDLKQNGAGTHYKHSPIQLNPAAATSPTSTTTTTATTTTTITSRVDESHVVVQTQYGAVRGVSNKGVAVFHGIPYAQAPVGNLRWKPPQPPTPWSPHEHDATWTRPGCPQTCSLDINCPPKTSEDCLYLEIYAPAASSSETPLLPVLLYIHGGSFRDMSSTSPALDATNFVARADVIVVMVEYRLGALGFLVTGQGDGHATGNYGILDQRQAINWVKDNIRAFGGDTNKVTLAGQSAGAQSVLIHMTSEDTSQYFRYVIVESPPLTLPYKTVQEAISRGERLAGNLHCSDFNNGIDMECLKDKTVEEILTAQASVRDSLQTYMDKFETWGPVIDDKVVISQTLDAMQRYSSTSANVKPMIWGEMSEEALIYVKEWLSRPISSLVYRMALSTMFSSAFTRVENLYPPTNQTDGREDLSVLATDFLFRCPLRWSLQQLQRSRSGQDGGVWSYTWDHPLDDDLPAEYSTCNGRVCHGVEVPYMFQSFSNVNISPSKKDLLLSNVLIDYYANFIKYGDPNGQTKSTRKKRRKPKRKDKQNDNVSVESNGSKLPPWPVVNNGQSKDSLTQIVFTRSGHVEQLEKREDERCDMWDGTNYAFTIK